MNDHTMIKCEKEADRDQLCMILVRNGYTVKRTRQKIGNKYINYIEFWKE